MHEKRFHFNIFLSLFRVELTNTTLSGDSSEEEEEEEEWRRLERQQQHQLLELQAKSKVKSEQDETKDGEMSSSSSRTSTTVTRDTNSEYKRSSGGPGKTLLGAVSAAARANKQANSLDFEDGNVRPLPLPLASLSGNKPMTKKPKRPKVITADTVLNAMNKAAEGAFSFAQVPPVPTRIPQAASEQSTNSDSVVGRKALKEGSLLDGHKLNGEDDNYEDDYEDDEEESKEGEDDSSEEEYDEDEDDEDELSLEGEQDLEKLKALTSGSTTSSSSAGKDAVGKDAGGEVVDSDEFLMASPESISKINSGDAPPASPKFTDFYSSSYVDGDAIREGFPWSKNKDGDIVPTLKPSISSETTSLSPSTTTLMSSTAPSTTEKQEIIECPLKCNRGSCTREPSTESGMEQSMTGYRCLCPMGTRGTFCEIGKHSFSTSLFPSTVIFVQGRL